MKTFKNFVTEAIIDQDRGHISSQIFLNATSKNPTLKPQVIRQIKNGMSVIEKSTKVIDYVLVGSILTRRYRDDADIDVTLLIDASEDELKSVRKELSKINGITVPNTSHPVNYFVTNDKEDYERKKELADGEFDIKNNKFIRKPIFKEFDVLKYMSDFKKSIEKIDLMKTNLVKNIVDFETMSGVSRSNIKYMRFDLLKKLESDALEISNLYQKLKQDRRDAFDRPITPEDIKKYGEKNRLPENVIYKLLEKYLYLDFLHKVEDILGDDKELSPEEANELVKMILNK